MKTSAKRACGVWPGCRRRADDRQAKINGEPGWFGGGGRRRDGVVAVG
jgi:hypothetical protein